MFPVYNSRKSPCKNFGKNLRSSAYSEHRGFLHVCIPNLSISSVAKFLLLQMPLQCITLPINHHVPFPTIFVG